MPVTAVVRREGSRRPDRSPRTPLASPTRNRQREGLLWETLETATGDRLVGIPDPPPNPLLVKEK